MIKRLPLLAAAILALAGVAHADFGINNLIGFAAKRAAVGGGTPVSFITSGQHEDTASSANGTWEYSFSVSHTKNAAADFIIVATTFPNGSGGWINWPTSGTGTRMQYCASAMTLVASSQATTSVIASAGYGIEWWYIRGPSSGACNIVFDIEGTGAGGVGINTEPPKQGDFLVMEFANVKSSGTPYEGVNTTSNATGTTGSLTLTPTTATMAAWGSTRAQSSTIGSVAPSVNIGTVDINFANTSDEHDNAGHYDAAGAKTFTLTWGAGVSRAHGISGFHLLPN